MGTVIKPEISKKKEHWIPKHRYYELKHFCFQYPYWCELLRDLNGFATKEDRSPTEHEAILKAVLDTKIKMVEDAADEATRSSLLVFSVTKQFIRGVTEGISYEKLNAQNPLACSKDEYYRFYRKFFWLLDHMRD